MSYPAHMGHNLAIADLGLSIVRAHDAVLISSLVLVRGGKKNPNPLAHPNPPTNCPPKPTYLINGQMGASPIRPN